MKVIHILSSDIYSGAEHVACEIIDVFKDKVDMEYVAPLGINVQVLNERDVKYTRINKVNIFEIRRIVKMHKPDIIHSHDFRTSVICAFSFLRIPIVSHLHNNNPWLKSINIYSIIFLFASYRLNRIIGVSKSILDEYRFNKYIKKKFTVLSNPIDTQSIVMRSKEKKINKKYDLVFLGRLANEKGPLRFINIVDSITEKIPNLKAVIIGDGKLRLECLEEINKRNLKENIDLLGFLSNPHPYVLNSKIMIMPSSWEGFGLAAVEALSLRRPVLASNVGGLVDIVNSDCGKLCIDDEEFIEESYKMLSDDEYYNSKSEMAGKRSVELDNKREYKDKLFKIYNSLFK